jgi:hypothetical protein
VCKERFNDIHGKVPFIIYLRNFNMTKKYFQLFATDETGSEEQSMK